jgi:hypothetical protein
MKAILDKQLNIFHNKRMKVKTIEKLLKKEMNRKEFLLYIGLFFLAITGISSFFKTVNESLDRTQPQSTQGFGAGAYGGRAAERSNDVS